MKKTILWMMALLWLPLAVVAKGTIKPGQLWPDNRGIHINAHGGGVMAYKGTYYWYG